MPTLSVAALAVDPVTQTRVYAVMAGSGGVFRSEDGGATWTQIAGDQGTPRGQGVLLIDPTNPSIFYLTSSNGLFRSTDSGAGWTRVKTGEVDDVAMDPTSPATIYAAVRGDGVYKTTSGGAAGDSAWTKLPGLPSSGFGLIFAGFVVGAIFMFTASLPGFLSQFFQLGINLGGS